MPASASRDTPAADTAVGSGELGRLFERERGRLHRTISRRVGDAEDAADMVQDAFARLAQVGRFSTLERPQAYLQRIVSNLLRDRFKRAENRFLVRGATLGDEQMPIAPPQQEWTIEADDLMDAYRAALAALSARTREVFLLHRVDELRYREIADRLDISVATVEYHMTRALTQLDEALNGDG